MVFQVMCLPFVLLLFIVCIISYLFGFYCWLSILLFVMRGIMEIHFQYSVFSWNILLMRRHFNFCQLLEKWDSCVMVSKVGIRVAAMMIDDWSYSSHYWNAHTFICWTIYLLSLKVCWYNLQGMPYRCKFKNWQALAS